MSEQALTAVEITREIAWFCGCGSPEAAAAWLLEALRHHPLFEDDNRAWWEREIPNEGARYFVWYALSDLGWTEHGVSVSGSWLTSTGERLRDGLARESADGFESLCAPRCIHGVPVDAMDGHDCMTAPDPAPKRIGEPQP